MCEGMHVYALFSMIVRTCKRTKKRANEQSNITKEEGEGDNDDDNYQETVKRRRRRKWLELFTADHSNTTGKWTVR